MLNTKFDLYNTEWLDVVFTDRNKEYGAYELRRSYSSTMLNAMGHTFGVIAFFCTVAFIIARYTPIQELTKTAIVDVPVIPPTVVDPAKKVEQPKAAQPSKPVQPVQPRAAASTIKFVTPVPTKDPVTEEMPAIKDLTGEIASTTTKGTDGPSLNVPETAATGTSPAPAGNGDQIVPWNGSLEIMPEPVGGFEAFGKFLGKNLRFPPQAQDAGVSGKVIVSFVIEKNGELSNISIVKGAGYGFDQEAARVLKLAKAWKPGKQNGQPVRVQYQVPINFQLPVEI